MNQKITVRTEHGTICYCILDPSIPYEKQLCQLFSFREGAGFSVTIHDGIISIIDYFHGENVADYHILSIEDCDLPVSLKWTMVE